MNGDWKDRLKLPDLFFSISAEMEKLLGFFEKPFQLLQVSSVPMVSYQRVIATSLRKKLKSFKPETTVAQKFQIDLLESLETRFAILLSNEIDYDEDAEVEDVGYNFHAFVQFKFCEFLDPSTIEYWGFVSDRMKRNFVEFAMVLNETFALNLFESLPITKKRPAGNIDPYDEIFQKATGSIPRPKKPDPGSKVNENAENCNSNGSTVESIDNDSLLSEAIEAEFENYRAEIFRGQGGICLKWWKHNGGKFPLIAKLASVMLAQPVGTPDVERRCSEAGNIITKLRNRIGHEKAANLFFIHANKDAEWVKSHPELKYLYTGIV